MAAYLARKHVKGMRNRAIKMALTDGNHTPQSPPQLDFQ